MSKKIKDWNRRIIEEESQIEPETFEEYQERILKEKPKTKVNGVWGHWKQGKSFSDDGRGNEYEETYNEGKLHGPWKHLIDGKLIIETNYKDDVLHGSFKEYYPSTLIRDRKIRTEGNYKNGKEEGIWKYYYKGKYGILEREQNFKNGILEGPYKIYSSSGFLKEEGTYKNQVGDYVYGRSVKTEEIFDKEDNETEVNDDIIVLFDGKDFSNN